MVDEVSGLWCGIAKRRMQGGEMLLTLAVDWQSSAVRDEEADRFRKVAGVSGRCKRLVRPTVDTSVDSRVA